MVPDSGFVEIHSLTVTAVLKALFAAGIIYENPAHGFGRGGKEMSAAFPILCFLPDQPNIGLMNQGGRLKCLAGPFL
jgi:hypothetical protein